MRPMARRIASARRSSTGSRSGDEAGVAALCEVVRLPRLAAALDGEVSQAAAVRSGPADRGGGIRVSPRDHGRADRARASARPGRRRAGDAPHVPPASCAAGPGTTTRRTADRNNNTPDNRNDNIGFRCASESSNSGRDAGAPRRPATPRETPRVRSRLAGKASRRDPPGGAASRPPGRTPPLRLQLL